jgi:hypothetical protein
MSNPIYVYTDLRTLQTEYTNESVTIKNAYSIAGQSYDIKFESTKDTIQKLHDLQAGALIQSLQDQMHAYLTAANALRAPDQTSFLLKNNRVFSVVGQQEDDITDIQLAQNVTVATIAANFQRLVAKPPQSNPLSSTLSSQASPSQAMPSSIAPAPVALPAPVSQWDKTLAPLELSSASNLLTFDPDLNLTNLGETAGLSAGFSGLTKLARTVTECASGKVGKTEAVVKALAATSEGITGLATGAEKLGLQKSAPIIFSVSKGLNLLVDLKDLINHVVNGAELPEHFWRRFVYDIIMCVALVLFFTAFKEAFLILAIVALLASIVANGHVLKEMFMQKRWAEMVVFIISHSLPFALAILGVPNAGLINIGVSVALTAALAYRKAKEAQKSFMPAVAPQVA